MDLTVLGDLSYGVYVIGSSYENKVNAMIASILFQVTYKPTMIAFSINKKNLTHKYIELSKKASISVLSTNVSMEFIDLLGKKSGKYVDKLSYCNFKRGISGVPIITDFALSFFELKITKKADLGSTTLFIGDIIDSGRIKKGVPLNVQDFLKIKSGSLPDSAPLKRD